LIGANVNSFYAQEIITKNYFEGFKLQRINMFVSRRYFGVFLPLLPLHFPPFHLPNKEKCRSKRRNLE